MDVKNFVDILGADFYTGVPDSLLKPLCNYLIHTYGTDPRHHVIAANEGNCTALAAGYQLSTGRVPVVYMQNSGEGNAVNPIASLLHEKVYAIPVIFVVGWRGEPGIHDEPQHIFQGQITVQLLETMGIPAAIIDGNTTPEDFMHTMAGFREQLAEGRSVALVVRKDALSYSEPVSYRNCYSMKREEIIQHIVSVSKEDPIVCTTGKASRELFEIREARSQSHCFDFLTVGSMGHSSSIALGIALNKPDTKIWCVDGDGAVLMHMGAMAVIGANRPSNLIHIVINNNAHETVGGMPTAAGTVDLVGVAKACGYSSAVSAADFDSLDKALNDARKSKCLSFIEVKCAIGARADLGRPTTTAGENKNRFMEYLTHCE